MTLDTEVSRRERKKNATRRAIHDAAAELALARGLSCVTIDAIANKADVAPRTFFNYYQSKEEAVVGRDPFRPRSLRSALLARPEEEDVLTGLRAVLEADVDERLADVEAARQRWRFIRQEPALRAAVAAEFEEIEQALVDAVAARTRRDPDRDLYPGLVVAAACGACRVAVKRWMDSQGRAGLHRLMGQAFDHLAAGLGDPSGANQ